MINAMIMHLDSKPDASRLQRKELEKAEKTVPFLSKSRLKFLHSFASRNSDGNRAFFAKKTRPSKIAGARFRAKYLDL